MKFMDEVPARDTHPRSVIMLKVFIALRLNEITKLAYILQRMGASSKP